jgi:hypothetical protein
MGSWVNEFTTPCIHGHMDPILALTLRKSRRFTLLLLRTVDCFDGQFFYPLAMLRSARVI